MLNGLYTDFVCTAELFYALPLIVLVTSCIQNIRDVIREWRMNTASASNWKTLNILVNSYKIYPERLELSNLLSKKRIFQAFFWCV